MSRIDIACVVVGLLALAAWSGNFTATVRYQIAVDAVDDAHK